MKTMKNTLLVSSVFTLVWCCSAFAGPRFNDPADVKAITAIEEALATQTSMQGLIDYYAPHATVDVKTGKPMMVNAKGFD